MSRSSDTAVDPGVTRVATALVVGVLAAVFDTTIMSVALHALADDLHASVATIQWVTTGYVLALAATVPLSGWLQRRIGGRRGWMLGLALFLAGSLLCSLAWSAPVLIAFRVVQGLGAGLMLPLMQNLLMQAAGGRNLGRIAATVGLPTMLGPILGPALGGIILSGLDWHWLFWVNIPLCVAGLVLARRMLPADGETDRSARLDAIGLALLVPAVVGLLVGLSNSASPGGFSRLDAWPPIAIGVALLAAFAWHALRRGERALVDVRLLRRRPVWSASALLFLSGISVYGAMLLLPLYWQQLRGLDALGAGLLLIPQGIGTLLSRTLAGRLTDRIGARWVAVAGFTVVAIATVPFAFAGTAANDVLLTAVLLVRGVGLGAVVLPLMVSSYQGLSNADIPHSSIITRTAQQLGGSFGTAVLAVILQAALTAHAAEGVAGAAAAYDTAFWWSIAFTALATALAFTLPGRAPETAESDSRETPPRSEPRVSG